MIGILAAGAADGRRQKSEIVVGTTLNHYRITKLLGRGGMGEVYAAEDTRLHRHVAVKVLPASVAADPERRQRFEREAHAIAALNHPNIVTIYSIEQADEYLFLCMELVQGRPLSQVIPARGLPLDLLLTLLAERCSTCVSGERSLRSRCPELMTRRSRSGHRTAARLASLLPAS